MDQYERALVMHRAGLGIREISAEIGVSGPNTQKWTIGTLPRQVERYEDAYESAKRLNMPFDVRYPLSL